MIQLAIETSGRTGSLAVLDDETLLKSFPLPSDRRTAATLTIMLREAVDWCQCQNKPIDFLSVAGGPGSFTGLRIGLTTAKTYCYATGLRLVAIDSIAAVAATVFSQDASIDSVLVAVNAYRGQVFTGTYQRARLLPAAVNLTNRSGEPDSAMGGIDPASAWITHLHSAVVLDTADLANVISSLPPQTRFAGDPNVLAKSTSADELAERLVPRTMPDATGSGLLGHHAAAWQQWVDPMKLTPRYLKASAAEEKADQSTAPPTR
tara:strand:- start:219884 stop:220672 length:789 start_codon:yes stop_codon:yes gene_type:complete